MRNNLVAHQYFLSEKLDECSVASSLSRAAAAVTVLQSDFSRFPIERTFQQKTPQKNWHRDSLSEATGIRRNSLFFQLKFGAKFSIQVLLLLKGRKAELNVKRILSDECPDEILSQNSICS